MPPYAFPPLDVHTLTECLNELGIDVTEQSFTKPSATFMKNLYRQLLEMIAVVRKEELDQPHFEGISILSYPELHEESIPELAFSRAL